MRKREIVFERIYMLYYNCKNCKVLSGNVITMKIKWQFLVLPILHYELHTENTVNMTTIANSMARKGEKVVRCLLGKFLPRFKCSSSLERRKFIDAMNVSFETEDIYL